MSKASIEAFLKPVNAKTRWTHRMISFHALKGCELTIREIASKVRLPYNAVQKRISELLEDGLIVVCGHKEEGENTNSIFKVNPEPPKYSARKPTLYKWLSEMHPNIMHEYETLIEKKL